MNFWRLVLGVDAPAQASVVDWELTFRAWMPWWQIAAWLLVMLLANAVVLGLYRAEQARLQRSRRLLLTGLRLAALNLLFALIFLPVVTLHFRGQRPRSVVLLVDNSLSMTQADERASVRDRLRAALAFGLVPPDAVPPEEAAAGAESPSLADVPAQTPLCPSRADLVRAVLANPHLDLRARLGAIGPLRTYLFGQRLHAAGENFPDQYAPAESQTALADALVEILQRSDPEPPAAIVVFTDGRDNASSLPLSEAALRCGQAGVPLHIYGVGCSEIGNIQLKDLAVPDTIFFDDALPVPVRWRVRGLNQGTATLTVRLGDLVVQKEVPVREGEDFREVLTLTPTRRDRPEEEADLIASLVFPGQETVTEDNTLRKKVRLVDRKVKVLYVEHAPRWEYKFLMTALLRDRRVEARFLLLQGSPEALRSGPPYVPHFPASRQELFRYDLVILGDVPVVQDASAALRTGGDAASEGDGAALSREQASWLADFVAEGGGLVVIAGRQHAPAEFLGSPLEELLPVVCLPHRFPMSDRRTEPFVPVLTRFGKRSELLRLAEDEEENERLWQELPGFHWFYPAVRLRPGAVALLVHPLVQAEGQPMPILALSHYGKGTVLFLASDETWRWRFNARDRYFGRFWGQVIYQLGLAHLLGDRKQTQLSLDRKEPVLGRPGYVFARVLDSNYAPLEVDSLPGRLTVLESDGTARSSVPLIFDRVPGQPGEYRALLPHDAAGRFQVRIEAPQPATLEYRVAFPPLHEREAAGMAETALKQAAHLSQGRFYREEDLHLLPARISQQSATFLQRQDVLPWNPLVLLLVVALLTAEWLVRKWSNLA
jgi:uncharacterized membrane protein